MIKIIDQLQENESQVEYVSRILKKDIISLKLKPGDVLSQNKVKELFDISRTPVREAFIKLEKEKLLEVLPQQGTKVTLIDTEWIKDFLFMRSSIEVKVIELIKDDFSDNYISKLENNIVQQDLSMDGDPNDFILLDNEFHKIIYESVGKLQIWESICPLQSSYDRLRSLFFQKHSSFEITIAHHKMLLNFIKKRNIEKAVLFVNDHIGQTFDLFEDIIKENSAYMK